MSQILSLQSPADTADWLVLKEGFLQKSKLAKGLIKSTKLRYFVLKQNPQTAEARLEYYEGRIFRGSTSLHDAYIRPSRKPGHFVVATVRTSNEIAREMTLQGEVEEARAWILALRQAAYAYHNALKPQATGSQSKADPAATTAHQPSPSVSSADYQKIASNIEAAEGSVRSRYQRDGSLTELDSQAIDDARWAALRKRHTQGTSEEEVDLEEDEDVRALRQMEEEEERRQEEERKAFLAQRQAKAATASAAPATAAAPAQNQPGDARKADDAISGVSSTLSHTHLSADDAGEVSEDDEEWSAQMQRAEEEEERRQEEERQAWLAAQKKS